ncbi:GPI ethanolamine phosphate transferase 2/3 subunit F, partial [Phenoliferia sp. Uapishka_3]
MRPPGVHHAEVLPVANASPTVMAKSKRNAVAAPVAPTPQPTPTPTPTSSTPSKRPATSTFVAPPFPIQHYISRVAMQTGGILFTLIQAANSCSPVKIATPSAAISVLVEEPVSVLLVSIAGLGFVQAWFGNWARNTRRTEMGLDKKKEVEAGEVKPKVGFWGAWKVMSNDALKGKAPHRNFGKKGAKPVFDLDFSFLGPASLVTLAAAGVLHIFAVLLGAPLFSRIPETFLLSMLVAILAIGPIAVAVGPTERYVWLRLFSAASPANDLELALLAPAIGTLLGCWAGAIPIPLDWDRPWQSWPTTSVVGCVLGHIAGSAVALVWCLIRSINSPTTVEGERVKSQ